MLTLRPAKPSDRAAIEAHMHAAFAPNVIIMGMEPSPRLANYAEVLATHEAHVAESDGAMVGALILLARDDDLYIWGIATTPAKQRTGIGGFMLAFAEARARELKRTRIRLRTGAKMVTNVAWYERHGFAIETLAFDDQNIVYMVKTLPAE